MPLTRRHPLIRLSLTLAGACAAVGCATFSQQPVADNVVRCREGCQAGLAAARQGRAEQAHELFTGAVDSCPVDERARRLLAESLWESNRPADAIKQMQEAVRLSGGDPELLVRLGEMHLAQGDLEGAGNEAQRAIRVSPRSATAWALDGDVSRQLGRLTPALQSYHRALAYREDYPRVQFAVADVYTRLGRHERALATLSALSQQYEPDHLPQRLLAMRGLAYKSMGRNTEAAGQLSLAAKAAPPTPDLLFELADALALSGETTAARVTARQALSLEPGHARSQRLIAQLGAPDDAAGAGDYY